MKSHNDIQLLKELFPAIRRLQELATAHGITDIFQDNGGKLLQLCLVLGLTALQSREGNDARDEEGNEYELKTVNILKTRSFSTHHHLNRKIIEKYRQVDWFFATYEGIELKKIYRVKKEAMEPWYAHQEVKWHNDGGKDINNPKVPIKFVEENGELVFSADEDM